MKLWTVIKVAIGLVIFVGSVSIFPLDYLSCGTVEAAPHKTKIYTKAVKNHSDITLPEKPGIEWPDSIALSPNGSWLAVVSNDRLVVRNMKTGHWIRHMSLAGKL